MKKNVNKLCSLKKIRIDINGANLLWNICKMSVCLFKEKQMIKPSVLKVNGRMSNEAEEEIFVVTTRNAVLKLPGKRENT